MYKSNKRSGRSANWCVREGRERVWILSGTITLATNGIRYMRLMEMKFMSTGVNFCVVVTGPGHLHALRLRVNANSNCQTKGVACYSVAPYFI